MKIYGDPEQHMDTEEPAPNYLDVQEHLDNVKRYCDTSGVPQKVIEMAYKLSREVQNHIFLSQLGTRHSSNISYEIIIELSLVQQYYSILLSYYYASSSEVVDLARVVLILTWIGSRTVFLSIRPSPKGGRGGTC